MKAFMKGFFIAGVILIVFSTCVQVYCQTLPRKAWLGVAAKAVDEPTAKANNLKTGEGLSVTTVVPNGTFDTLGIKTGDVVVSINKRIINSSSDLIASAQSLTEGLEIEVEIVSNGTRTVKRGTAKGRPKENSDNAEVNYDALNYELGTLRTITYIPKNKTGKMPAVFYVQGLPCESHELGPNSKDPRKMIFEDWVKAGFIVFRVERPNVGDSRTSKDCRDLDFDEELALNNAGYKKLLSYDFVDQDNIFLFGHSLGGVTVPFLAQMKQPKGIIAYGTVMRSWFEYFIDIHRIQFTYAGASHVEAERETRAAIPFLYEWLELGKSADELRKNPAYKEIMDGPGSSFKFNGRYFQTRAENFFYTMSRKNVAEAWSKVRSKVLIMYGEYDVQAINSRDSETIAAIVNQTGAGQGEFMLVPKTEHIFMKVGSHRQVFELIGAGKYFEYGSQNYNPEVGRLTNEWMIKAQK